MRVALLSHPDDLSAYLDEILRTWGLALYDRIDAETLATLDPADAPVVICPDAEDVERCAEGLIAFAQRGGTIVCFRPQGALAAGAGLAPQGAKETPLRLRLTAHPAAGLAGESLPIVGRAESYEPLAETRVLAYLAHPGRYAGESAGITKARVGQGWVIAFAFDLPLCMLLLRQGDPNRVAFRPPGDRCGRPSYLAAEIGPGDAGWIPFADLLGRLLVDLVRRSLPAPAPLWSHLPGTAPGILLYSGDEDGAAVAANEDQFAGVAAAGGRMNLYIIPNSTQSTRADVQRYRLHHDVGPHPNLRPMDGRSVAEWQAELERQIRMFEERFDVPARSLRNHCTAWIGYLEPVEVMEKLGVRMDGNYFSGTLFQARDPAPYAAFGAAMPMRFCRPDGRLLNVFQQHTHVPDDVMFGDANYSYKLSPEQSAVIARRIFADIATRFHTPYALCIHPGGWVRFSRPHAQDLLRQAAERGMPIWSFDQWCAFWEARDTWRFREVTWDGVELRFVVEGQPSHPEHGLLLPAQHVGRSLAEVRWDQEIAAWHPMTRYHEAVALVPVPAGRTTATVSARYR